MALFATDGPGTAGSNGWLVSGERTVTGHAIVAGDPHRFIEEPGVYQQIHLSCPEFDVVGLAVPGVPGIAHFGHTGTVAWAITNAMADYQDLYRERLRRTGAGVEALGPDGTWHRAARHTETIHVAGEDSVEVEVIETDRGPVIAGGPEGLDDGTPAALSLRYPPRVTADLGFGALLPLLRARRVADVDRALDAWAEPVNVVQAADTEGGLLHRVAGRVPVRATANRLRPVPAWEPGHEWTGWHTPPRAGLTDGVAVMANQRGPATPLGVEFAPPHRADRIAALLAGKERWSAADMPALHTDTHLASAGPLLDLVTALDGLGPGAAALRDRLLAWDRHMDADSADAATYAAVRGAVVRRLAAHPALAPAAVPPAYPEVLQPWLALVPRIAYALEHLLRAEDPYGIDRAEAVRAALEEVAAEPPAGTWGDTHRLAPGGPCRRPPAARSPASPATTTACCAPPRCPDSPTVPPAARPPATSGTWPTGGAAAGWCPTAPPASPAHPTTVTSSPCGSAANSPRWSPTSTGSRRKPMTDPHPAPAPSPYTARTAVHEQELDGFGTVRVLPLDPAADAGVIHRWVSEERAAFWGMTGLTPGQVADVYAHMDTLDTHHAYLVVKDGEPVALFQTYEPEADRVSECYPVQPGDIGVHLLLAPAGPEGVRPGWTAALASALMAYVLVGLDRQRIVVDPDVDNEKAIARFLKQGFTAGPAVVLPEVDLPEVYLPEKKAQLAFLRREVAFPA